MESSPSETLWGICAFGQSYCDYRKWIQLFVVVNINIIGYANIYGCVNDTSLSHPQKFIRTAIRCPRRFTIRQVIHTLHSKLSILLAQPLDIIIRVLFMSFASKVPVTNYFLTRIQIRCIKPDKLEDAFQNRKTVSFRLIEWIWF